MLIDQNSIQKQYNEKFDFYRGIGLSEKHAAVLSYLTYGGKDRLIIDYLIQHYNQKDNFLDYCYDCLTSDDFEKDYNLSLKKERPDKPTILRSMFGGAAMAKSTVRAKNAVFERETSSVKSMGCYEEACPAMPGLNNVSEMPLDIEMVRSDSYDNIEPNSFKKVIHEPTSTFRTTYNTAAMMNIKNAIRKNARIELSMVRTEEVLNYGNYDLKNPKKDEKFNVTSELVENGKETYLFFGIKGTNVIPTRQNIVLLLDVSGSMWSRNETTQEMIYAFYSKLNPGDTLSLVTYSDKDHIVLDTLLIDKENDIHKISEALLPIEITGCTYGSAGINQAYDIIEKNFDADAINRVIIITDGDLNFGTTSKDGLKGLISEKKKTGAYFSAIGTGFINLQDDKLEILAKNGNGNYYIANSIDDIKETILDKYNALVYPIATDVKAQVEFNPKYVSEYLLIGYENRTLNHDDFKNNDVIAEPFGSGAHSIAMYKVKLNKKDVKSDLKYQDAVLKDSDEIATIKIRYKDVNDEKVHERSFPVKFDIKEQSQNVDTAVALYKAAEELRSTGKTDFKF